MEKFILENSSAIFGLLGALLGVTLAFIGNIILKNREFSLRTWDRLLDRRVKAHENLLKIAVDMRLMVMTGGDESTGEVARSPHFLMSKDGFDKWFSDFTILSQEGTTWLSTKSKRELNFVQDYLVSLHRNLEDIASEKYPLVGQIVRLDFIYLSSNLEKSAFHYFEKDVNKRKLNDLSEWHKYPLEETIKRLNETELLKNLDKIKDL